MSANQDEVGISVRNVIERINQIEERIKRKSTWYRILFSASCLSLVFVFPATTAIMAAAALHPAAIFGASLVHIVAVLSLAWWLYVAIHAYDTDHAICEKAKGSLSLLEIRFRASNPGGPKEIQTACEIVLQETLSGVVRPLGFGVKLPPMPETPITDQIIAVVSAFGRPTRRDTSPPNAGDTLERRPK